jgi:hypothetical protein
VVLLGRLALGAEGENRNLLEVRAAAELADPTLHPLLKQLSQDWEGDDDAQQRTERARRGVWAPR